MSFVRGVLSAGRFRTHRELNGVSDDDRRNILIVELGGRTNQSGAHFQAMDDATLAGAGAVLVFLREAKIRDDAQLKTISDDDQRNLMIIEMGAQTNLSGPELQGMSNLDLVLLGLGKDGSFIRGVLLAGRFRTHRELIGTSHDDQRNTLIVELAGRTNQSGSHFEAMDDATLAGAGAVLVFLREAKIRDDAQLKTISDDDQRNLMIIEMGAQTNLSGPELQGLSNIDLVRTALGGDPLRDRKLILAKYDQIGGRMSPLGLPVDVQMPIINTAQGARIDFRGGPITLPPGNLLPIPIRRFRAELWWVGIECQIRQEGKDEIYGGVGVMVPGSGLSRTEKFPDDAEGTSDMGPDGQRIINLERQLYDGPPMDIVLTASLIEHDSGDTSAVKAKIADAVAKAAQGLAGFAGISAEDAAANQDWVNDLTLGLLDAVGDAFGINDDPYTPQQLRLRWPEIQGKQFIRKMVRRDDDPRTIEFTHSITLSGTDEGGDRGQYALYFDVRLFTDEEVL